MNYFKNHAVKIFSAMFGLTLKLANEISVHHSSGFYMV